MSGRQFSQEEITAYHEAGHAVVALAVGRHVDKVSITARSGRLGQLKVKGKSKKRRFRDRAEDDLLMLLGGLAAEVQLTGSYCSQGASHDLLMVKRLAAARAGSPKAAVKLCERMLSKVEYLLSAPENWQAVEYMVADLLEKKDISGRAARHHFDRARREVQ